MDDPANIPSSLRDDLKALSARPEIPPTLDAAILARAHQTLAHRAPRSPWYAWTAAALAASIALILTLLSLWYGPFTGRGVGGAKSTLVDDINGDGRVDILDALLLAQTIERTGHPLRAPWNPALFLQRQDADRIARQIVTLTPSASSGAMPGAMLPRAVRGEACIGTLAWLLHPLACNSQLLTLSPSHLVTLSAPSEIHFTTLDLYLDPATHPLAAYQIEITPHVRGGDPASETTIVSLYAGDHPAFSTPPFYDPAALNAPNSRLLLAAFSTAPPPHLPTTRPRITRIGIAYTGPRPPTFSATLITAATPDAHVLPATLSLTESPPPATSLSSRPTDDIFVVQTFQSAGCHAVVAQFATSACSMTFLTILHPLPSLALLTKDPL